MYRSGMKNQGIALDGESMSGVCREFGISRKTGYKIFDSMLISGGVSSHVRP